MKNGHPKIESGLPLPNNHRGKFGWLKEMKPGDSVIFPGDRLQASNAASHYFGRGNYAIRNENGESRLWRIR